MRSDNEEKPFELTLRVSTPNRALTVVGLSLGAIMGVYYLLTLEGSNDVDPIRLVIALAFLALLIFLLLDVLLSRYRVTGEGIDIYRFLYKRFVSWGEVRSIVYLTGGLRTGSFFKLTTAGKTVLFSGRLDRTSEFCRFIIDNLPHEKWAETEGELRRLSKEER